MRLRPLLCRGLAAGALLSALTTTAFAQSRTAISTEVYRIDFESAVDPTVVIAPTATITDDPAEVLEGTRSLKLAGIGATVALRPDLFPLAPGKVYIIEYRYRGLTGGPAMPVNVGFWKVANTGEGFYLPLRGPITQTTEVGTDSRSVQAGIGGDAFIMHTWDRDVVIDEIRILQHDVEARAPAAATIDYGFPRLANYQLLMPDAIAYINNTNQAVLEDVAARFDLMMGPNLDHTLGGASWVGRLKALNPRLRILPYKQAFMAQYEDGIDNSGLIADFNAGLQDNWFLRTPQGGLVSEPFFPQNVQLKHTIYGSSGDAHMLYDYTAGFLRDSVLSTGLWAGIHFDQPEWYINPLLGDPAPAIDLDDDGTAEPTPVVHNAWALGFMDYFATMASRLGTGTLLYGNAGHIPGNTVMLPLLNGWQGEVISPYPILQGGEWNTEEPSQWYRLLDNYRLATRHARAPQIVSLEFTGRELGVQTGGMTPNGYPQRLPEVEWRDYRRMRLGLTTALLGNGFFEYDYVDNTTVPVWFDEYAVDASGVATTSLSGKGYLGQPLGDAAELTFASSTLFQLDFETATLPQGVTLGPGRFGWTSPEVISGVASFVATKTNLADQSPIFEANLPLVPGKTYQLLADYRILDYQPTSFLGLMGIAFRNDDHSVTPGRSASLYLPDTSGPGQQGTLRAVIKATAADSTAEIVGGFTDTGTVAIDNVRLVEATGGVWRRDFENGIVLVNPTPEPLYVTQADVAGSRNRTNVRRIAGSQVAGWNDGSPVTAGIWLGSGDGIILLAERIAGAAMPTPRSAVTVPDATGVTIAWAPESAAVAGYLVRYGENVGELTRSAAAGPTGWVHLTDLTPGVSYVARITAHDFLGHEGTSADVTFTMPGVMPDRPQFTLSSQTPALAPGSVVVLEGSGLATGTAGVTGSTLPLTLAGATVHVNGVEAALLAVSPSQVTFITPWQVAGDTAVVTVTRNEVISADRVAPIVAARPWLLSWPGGDVAIATHESGPLLTATEPASPGGVIDLLSVGFGAVRPHPNAGEPVSPQFPARATSVIEARIGGMPAEVIGAWLLPTNAALYGLRVRVPAGTPGGLQTVDITVGGVPANVVRIPVQ